MKGRIVVSWKLGIVTHAVMTTTILKMNTNPPIKKPKGRMVTMSIVSDETSHHLVLLFEGTIQDFMDALESGIKMNSEVVRCGAGYGPLVLRVESVEYGAGDGDRDC